MLATWLIDHLVCGIYVGLPPITPGSLLPTSDQGDVGSNPAQGNYSFPQKLSSVEFPVTYPQFLLNLDCESICDPPGGHTLLAQGIYLTDYIYIYIYI